LANRSVGGQVGGVNAWDNSEANVER